MRNILLATAAVGALALAAPAAQATVIQVFANTTGTLPTTADNTPLNNTAVGGFTVTVDATGQPLPGGGILDSTAIQVNAGANAGTLYIWVTETGVTSPIGTLNFVSGLENNSSSLTSVTETTSLDTGNTAYATTTLLSTELVTPGEDNSLSHIATTGAGPYSVTEEFVIVDGGAGVNDTNTIQLSGTPVPEPVSMALLGVGLLGLGFVRKRSV